MMEFRFHKVNGKYNTITIFVHLLTAILGQVVF